MTRADERVERISQRQVDKFGERRRELADAAIQTLSELGYARTSLREIAANSAYSHGVLHYYFKDKDELILAAVRLFRDRCARRYEGLLSQGGTAEELAAGLAARLVGDLAEGIRDHRLWYDLKSQAMFRPELQADVLEIDDLLADLAWRLATRYAELRDCPVTVPRPVVYATLDGIVHKALLDHLAGVPDALPRLRRVAREVLDLFLSRA